MVSYPRDKNFLLQILLFPPTKRKYLQKINKYCTVGGCRLKTVKVQYVVGKMKNEKNENS
jgi:hypothetical protein